MNLDVFFSPRSVAVVGASRTPGKVGHDVLADLIASGYTGEIVVINPETDSILDRPVYPDLQSYGKPFDLAVIVVPRDRVLEAIQESIDSGAQGIVVISAGFRELGQEGFEIEKKMVAICRRRAVRMLGPNCLGIINTHQNLNASFAGRFPEKGGVSIFSQSGAVCAAMLDLCSTRHLGVSKMISIGNKADINEIDLLSYLAKDEQTKVIIGYLEDISGGESFVKAAEEAAAVKPVIILKAGITPTGLKAAASHTGVLAPVDSAYGAAFKRSGVVQADTFEALFDYSAALALQPLPAGDRVLIITNAGGPGTIAADAVEKAGLRVAILENRTITLLREKLPRESAVNNPIDVLGDADPERYGAAIKTAQKDDSVDAVLLIMTPQTMTRPAETAEAMAAAIDGSKPVLASFMGGRDVLPGRSDLSAAGLPDFDSPERAVAALKAMHHYALWKNRPPRQITHFRVNRRRVERIITRRLRTGRTTVGEIKGKDILSAYGFKIPLGSLAVSQEEAIEIAERIGYPVALKIGSPTIIHKSDLGGIQLNLANAEAVEDAYDLMMLKITKRAPQAQIDGIYVEQMIPRGLEVILGMNRDPQFGPMLMFGVGGIFIEVLEDVAFHLAPITESEAIQMLKSTRSYSMLENRRDKHGIDINAIASGLQRISQLATDFPQITEIDINPFIVGEAGMEPVVADVHLTLAQKPV
jgi:acetate---CoA ligase (ADP-forming)